MSRWPLESLLYDLRFAVRGLQRGRAFTLAAIAMLAIGIGLNVAVYAVRDTMLFRGYPLVPGNDRLVFLQERGPANQCCMSYPDFEDWRDQAQSFAGLGYVGAAPITFRDGDGRPMDMRVTTLSANAFGLLGVAPLLGRDFTAADERPGAAPVAILNHRFWERRFGRRADVVGSTVHINGVPATIVGVMPERFDFPLKVDDDLWMPVVHTAELRRRGLRPGGFTVVGRLRDGVTLEDARAELETINRRLELEHPATNRGVVPTVATHSEMNSGPDAAMIWGSVWAASWLVLLVACANLANLTLVRTVGRWREFSTRMALGGGIGRMVRQILFEGLSLAAVAGALGWWITQWSVRTWDAVTASQYQVLDYTVDAGTFGYLVAITVTAAVLVSLAPIGRVRQLGVNGALKGDARGVTQSMRAKHLSAGLVAVQMALAIVLLSGAGVLIRSFTTIVGAETGVRDAQTIVVGRLRLASDTYPTPESRHEYFARLAAHLPTIAGVSDSAVATTVPVRFAAIRALAIDGRPSLPDGEMRVGVLGTGPDYFRVIGAGAVAGREFNGSDGPAGRPVAIVNESFVATFWPGEDPLGKRIRVVEPSASAEWRTVVGVVRNIMQGDPLRQQFKPLVYVPFVQEPAPRTAYFLVRTTGPTEPVAGAIRTATQGLDTDVQLENFGTLQASFAFDRDFMDAEHSELGKHAKVAPVFATIALLLAAIGLGAVMAHSVSQRTKEIGVRMAIGAAAPEIKRLIVRDGMRPVALGLVAGLAASLAVNRLLQSQLVGVSPYDPATLATTPVLMILIALLACQLPSRRAVQVDPVVALRHE
jgi:putative ABC transport system permease protein